MRGRASGRHTAAVVGEVPAGVLQDRLSLWRRKRLQGHGNSMQQRGGEVRIDEVM